MALPRNSFVRSALESGRSVASLLRLAMAAWWNGDLSIVRRSPRRAGDRGAHAIDARGPQPLCAYPELHRLVLHDRWLADPAVRVQCMWEDAGWSGDRYRYFVLSNGRLRTLGLLMREHDPAYTRLHANYAFAAVDGALWAREIRDGPVVRPLVWGGSDRRRGGTWSVIVVQRPGRYELQITTGGLIPLTRDYRSLEDATLSAEAWLTELHDRMEDSPQPVEAEWLM